MTMISMISMILIMKPAQNKSTQVNSLSSQQKLNRVNKIKLSKHSTVTVMVYLYLYLFLLLYLYEVFIFIFIFVIQWMRGYEYESMISEL